jgi:cation diffusion facilitator CzcD-associated flavoprotein CzcO
LQVNPLASIIIYESASSIGGVWAEERLYPGLKTNNLLGTYEFSDYPMCPKTYGLTPGEHIPGEVVHQYLTDFAKHFGIYKYIQFRTKVESALNQPGVGWLISASTKTKDGEEGKQFQKLTSKLIVATGMTSDPFMPDLAGSASFGAPLFHSKDFPKHVETLDSAKNVSVYGGTKSGWDMVYAYASKGIKVDWIIRESGHGPVWSKFDNRHLTIPTAIAPFPKYQLTVQYSVSTLCHPSPSKARGPCPYSIFNVV